MGSGPFNVDLIERGRWRGGSRWRCIRILSPAPPARPTAMGGRRSGRGTWLGAQHCNPEVRDEPLIQIVEKILPERSLHDNTGQIIGFVLQLFELRFL